ncbi:ABC transporter permease [Microbacterium sp. 18062]|uniref:ABC transporter permease n=1 Tax=Microbacterium sp. 18062 TaxID=2681410 RepID=UPI001F33F474|nr:ABC transporter permease [Microbacterium sp. 18062]
MRWNTLIREAAASARSQPVASTLTLLMVTGMVLAVLLTTGRTVGAEQQVLGSIDSVGTRAITIRAEDGAGITSDVLNRMAAIEGIEWAGAFSTATDATNTLVADGTRVPVRYAYGTHLERLGIPQSLPVPGQLAYASPGALEQFGMADDAGSITLTTGETFGIGGRLDVPDFLSASEPLTLIPVPDAAGTETVNVIVIISAAPELITPVSNAALSVLAAEDPTKVTVQTSETLAQLRGLVQGQLVSFSRGLVLALLAVTGILLAVLLYGLVMMRRKDFGRRRALGATRSSIISLLIAQTLILTTAGITLGTLTGAAILLATGDPWPGISFTAALAILTLLTATLAAIAPAIVASRRDPIRELRVP